MYQNEKEVNQYEKLIYENEKEDYATWKINLPN